MKKFLLMCIVALSTMLVSCDQPDVHVHVNVEQIPCTFEMSSIIADVDDTPVTRTSTSPRVINYLIDYKDPAIKDVKSTVEENTLLEINLEKDKEFTYYFVYDDNMTELSDDMIRINSKETYHVQKTMTISKPINESVVLTRQSAQFIAKRGNIPSGLTFHVDAKVKNQFKWTSGNTMTDDYTETYFCETHEKTNCIDVVGAKPYWILGNKQDGIEVRVYLKNSQNKIVKEATYHYTVSKNHIKTVTYNINNVDINGDGFFVSIDDTPMVNDEDGNQQIGKPQFKP